MDKETLDSIKEYLGVSDALPDVKFIPALQVQRRPTAQYSSRHISNWYRPEYNFNDIQNAEGTESLIGRAIELKTSKFLLTGWEFVGENIQTVNYINKRIKQIELASAMPFDLLIAQTVADLDRFANAMWVIVRDANNSGGRPYVYNGKQVQPIAGLFIIPFETVEFFNDKSGNLVKIRQVVPGVTQKPEFKATDIIHFYKNKKPGFTVGSPILTSVLEDVTVLRRLEENVLELVEANLFPLFHYKIGNDKYPEKTNPKSGLRETEVVAQTLSYMPASGVYISDWRHEITAIGSEGKALRVDMYLEYFKKRVYSGLGIAPVDFGEGGDSSRSTAQTQSKALIQSVESLQKILKTFLEYYLITPLLLESTFTFDIFAPENFVEIKFNKIDTQEQTLVETAANSLWQNNLITHEELRHKIGMPPIKAEEEKRLMAKMFPEPVPANKTVPGSSDSPMSRNQHRVSVKRSSTYVDYIESKSLIDEYSLEKEWFILQTQIKNMTNGRSPGEITKKVLESWVPEVSDRLYSLIQSKFDLGFESMGLDRWDFNLLKFNKEIKDMSENLLTNLVNHLVNKLELLKTTDISTDFIFKSLMWRIKFIQNDVLNKAYNYGRAIALDLEDKQIYIKAEESACETCKKHSDKIITKKELSFQIIPPDLLSGHPNCKCKVEGLNEQANS